MKSEKYVFDVRIDPEDHPEAEASGGFMLTVGAWYTASDLVRVVNESVRERLVDIPRCGRLRAGGIPDVLKEDREMRLSFFVDAGVTDFRVCGPATLRLTLARREAVPDSRAFRWETREGDFDWHLLERLHARFRDERRSRSRA